MASSRAGCQKVIVLNETQTQAIENAALEIMSRKPKQWAEYSIEFLDDQQELYLEVITQFDDVPIDLLPEQAAEYFFTTCVYLAVFRTVLQAKRADLPPTPLSIVN